MFSLYRSFFLRPADESQARRLVTVHRVSIMNTLPIFYRERIRSVEGVEEVTVMQWFGGTYKDPRDVRNMFARFAVDPERLLRIYPEYELSEEEKTAFLGDPRACIVGRPLAERLGLRTGDHVQIQGDIYPVNLDLIVRGIYDCRRDNENLFFHNRYLEESAPLYKNFAMFFALSVRPGYEPAEVAARIDATFLNSQAETRTDTERAFEMSFLSYLGNVKMFIAAVGGALTFAVLLVMANTMAMSARERVRETGVLRTLGFTQGAVFRGMVAEAVLLALGGGALGLLLAEGVCAVLRGLPSVFVDLKTVVVTPGVVLACLAVALLLGAASSAGPAWLATRLPITTSLRQVD
jgi:putative ABC transport system permease protein